MNAPNVITAMPEGDDRSYMEWLYRRYHRLMYATAWGFFREMYTVEDVVSIGCIALMRNVSTLRRIEEPRLRVYIVAAVRSAAINYYNRQKRTGEYFASISPEIFENTSDDFDLEARFVMEDELEHVLSALNRLPEKERKVMLMKYAEDKKDEEIAEAAGLSPNSIRKYVSRARKRLVQMMDESEKE